MKSKSINFGWSYSSDSGYKISLRKEDVAYIEENTGGRSVIVMGDIQGGPELMTTCHITEDFSISGLTFYHLKNADIDRFMQAHKDAEKYNTELIVHKRKAVINIISKTVGMGDKGGPGMLDAIFDREEEEQPAKTKEPPPKEEDSQ